MKKLKLQWLQDQLQRTLHHQQCFRILLLEYLRLLRDLRIHRQQNLHQIDQQILHLGHQKSLLLLDQRIERQVEQKTRHQLDLQSRLRHKI